MSLAGLSEVVSLLLVGIYWAHSCGFIQLVVGLGWKVLKGFGANCGLTCLSSSSRRSSFTTGEPELPYRMVHSKREHSGRTRLIGQILINPLLASLLLKSRDQAQDECGKGSFRGESTGMHSQWGTGVTVYHIWLWGREIDSFRELDKNAPDGGIHS